MSIMLLFSHQENLLTCLRRYGVLHKVKFKITKEVFIVVQPNCVLLTN